MSIPQVLHRFRDQAWRCIGIAKRGVRAIGSLTGCFEACVDVRGVDKVAHSKKATYILRSSNK